MEEKYRLISEVLKARGYPEPQKIVPLHGDASNRSYFRALLPGGNRESIILMLTDRDVPARSEEIGDEEEGGIEENPFINVQRLFRKIGIRVPEIFFHDESRGIMGLEDLGDCILEEYVKKGYEYKSKYEKAVDFLVLLHTASVEDRQRYVPYSRRFGFKTFFWEFEHYLEYGLEKNGFEITPAEREQLLSMFHTLSSGFESLPYALTHRDYHSRNIMIMDDEIGIIDFQDALMAPWHYDLVSLLRDAYVKLPDDMVDELVERYVSGMEEKLGISIDRKKFREDFDLIALHRNLKAIGRFYYVKLEKNKDHLIKYVPTLYEYVFEYIDRYPILSPLRDIFKRNRNLLKKLLVNPS